MVTFFSTFIPGLGEVVEEAVKLNLSGSNVLEVWDGLIIWQSNASFEKLKKLRFFNNTFVLLFQKENTNIESLIKDVISYNNLKAMINPLLPKHRTSFRIMFSKENQPISVNRKLHINLERKIKSKYLYVNRNNPDYEFVVFERSEGFCFFGLRLTRHQDYKKLLYLGELRPELAYLMCLMSEPSSDDIFIDPFAGYGSIPIARASNFPFNKIYASDLDLKQVELLKMKTRTAKININIGKWDATQLVNFRDCSIDKIVTDPPWGIYAKVDIENLYYKFLKEAKRILKIGGVLVILIANREMFGNCLKKVPELRLLKKADILVSGKKVSIYKIVKIK